jgi:hypothetical protein
MQRIERNRWLRNCVEKTMIFQLAWNNFDWPSQVMVEHPTKTKADFEADVQFLFRKYGRNYIESRRTDGIFPFISKINPYDWAEHIAQHFEELGYVFFTPETIEIRSNDDISDTPINNPDGMAEFKVLVGDELFDLAVIHNKTVDIAYEKELEKYK